MTRMLESFKSIGEELKKLQKENWQKGLAETAKKRVELLPEHEDMHKLPQWLRIFAGEERFHAKKSWTGWRSDSSRTEKGVEKVAGLSQNEAKYEEEFQPLQANEGRRGSHASPAAWCEHFEATMVEEVRSMRPRHAAQIVERMQKVVDELQTGAVRLLVPITPVAGHDSGEERGRSNGDGRAAKDKQELGVDLALASAFDRCRPPPSPEATGRNRCQSLGIDERHRSGSLGEARTVKGCKTRFC